ncbi:HNH endonuclease [Priestia megaterium]|nr:HNH endonuclease [Priestia megaterium]
MEKYIHENFNKLPIPILANKLGIDVIELCKTLRKKGYIRDLQPSELQFIKENLNKMPVDEIKDKLGMTKSQLNQIRQRYGLVKKMRNTHEYTEEEVINKTRWLIEEKLKLEVDDLLPKKITGELFQENKLFAVLSFAETKKKSDSYYKYFSAVAFLLCKSYPDFFKPFQFAYSPDTINYFKKGKRYYFREVLWVLENKLGLNIDMISEFSTLNSFLTRKDLDLYGLGYHLYKNLFESKKQMLMELMKFCMSDEVILKTHTRYLRQELINQGIDVSKCFLNGCTIQDDIEIHHIVPQKAKQLVRFNINETNNLIPLCKNHHVIAGRVNWKQFLNIEKASWRQRLMGLIGDNFEADVSASLAANVADATGLNAQVQSGMLGAENKY